MIVAFATQPLDTENKTKNFTFKGLETLEAAINNGEVQDTDWTDDDLYFDDEDDDDDDDDDSSASSSVEKWAAETKAKPLPESILDHWDVHVLSTLKSTADEATRTKFGHQLLKRRRHLRHFQLSVDRALVLTDGCDLEVLENIAVKITDSLKVSSSVFVNSHKIAILGRNAGAVRNCGVYNEVGGWGGNLER